LTDQHGLLLRHHCAQVERDFAARCVLTIHWGLFTSAEN
jgi:hypothetical protein